MLKSTPMLLREIQASKTALLTEVWYWLDLMASYRYLQADRTISRVGNRGRAGLAYLLQGTHHTACANVYKVRNRLAYQGAECVP